MENAITADFEKIKHHIYYDILQNLYEKHKDNSQSTELIEKIQTTAQQLLDVTFTKKKYKIDPLWVSLVYTETNKDIINNTYRNIVKEVAEKLNIELVTNPTEDKLSQINQERQNYFIISDLPFNDLIESLEVIDNNQEKARTINSVVIESDNQFHETTKSGHPVIIESDNQFNEKTIINSVNVGSSDMLLITDMEDVPFTDAAHYMYHLGAIEESPFKNLFKDQPIISLPILENSMLLSFAGRSNLLVYEISDIPQLNLNEDNNLTDKNIRDENFINSNENSNNNKLN